MPLPGRLDPPKNRSNTRPQPVAARTFCWNRSSMSPTPALGRAFRKGWQRRPGSGGGRTDHRDHARVHVHDGRPRAHASACGRPRTEPGPSPGRRPPLRSGQGCVLLFANRRLQRCKSRDCRPLCQGSSPQSSQWCRGTGQRVRIRPKGRRKNNFLYSAAVERLQLRVVSHVRLPH